MLSNARRILAVASVVAMANCGENVTEPATTQPGSKPLRSGGAGSYTFVVLDSFSGTNGTNIVSHTANTGQSWSLSGGFTSKIQIQNNTAQLTSGADNNNWRMAITSDAADDTFDIWADYTRGSQNVLGDYAQLEFLAKLGANPPTDRVYVSLSRQNATTIMVRVVRTFNFSTAQSLVLDSAFPLDTGATKRFGATITGLGVQVWWEPAGGGTRTNIGSPVTLTADYRDGLHRRVAFNFVGAQPFSVGSPRIDNFTVVKPAPLEEWTLLTTQFPDLDTAKVVSLTADTFRFYRTNIQIYFNADVSDSAKRAFFTQNSMNVLGVTRAGVFFVRIPDPGSSSEALFQAVATLRAKPQVNEVSAIPRSGLEIRDAYRHPDDGPGQRRADWIPTTTSTWAMRAIRAPLAWGCETGTYDNTPVRLAIFEWKHQPTHPELAQSTPHLWEAPDNLLAPLYQPAHPDTVIAREAHASATTGLLSAEGDNQSGIAGAAWRSDLYLYAGFSSGNRQLPLSTGFYLVSEALRNDAPRVLSISTDQIFRQGTPQAQIVSEIQILAVQIRELLDAVPNLLIVVAAGNERYRGTIANYIQQPQATLLRGALLVVRDQPLYAGRIVVVAGTITGNGFWDISPYNSNEGSNFFTDVTDIAAPAQDVAVLAHWTGQTGAAVPIVTSTGTSLSAPLVAGVAGLLLGFEPQLTAAQVKDYIVRGAPLPRPDPQSGQVILTPAVTGAPAPIFQIDAYSSLTLLAMERTQIPLCGNRTWVANGEIRAERDTATHTTELLTALTEQASIAHVRHGGRRVEVFGASSGDLAFVLQNGQWVPTAASPTTPDGGTYLSLFQASHDLDTGVTYSSMGNGTYDIKLRDLHTGALTLLRTLIVGVQGSVESTCVEMDGAGNCQAYNQTGSTTAPSLFLAYSPLGNEILAVVSWRRTDFVSANGFQLCPGQPPNGWTCQSTTYSYQSLGSDVHLIRIPTGDTISQWSVPDKTLSWAAVSEDGGQTVGAEYSISGGYTLEWTLNGGLRQHSVQETQQIIDCGVQYRAHGTGGALRPFLLFAPPACSDLGRGTLSPAARILGGL